MLISTDTTETVSIPGFEQPLQLRRGENNTPMLCARSLIEGLNLSWQQWRWVVITHENAFKPVAGRASDGRQTQYVPASRVLHLLDMVSKATAYATARRRATAARQAWRQFQFRQTQRIQATTGKPGTQVKQARKRVATAELVQKLFDLMQGGMNYRQAGLHAGVGEETARRISNGTYENLPPDAQEIWLKTFGTL